MEKKISGIVIAVLILITGCSTATDSSSPAVIGPANASLSTAAIVTMDDAQGYKPEGAEIASAMNEVGVAVEALVESYKAGDISAEELTSSSAKFVADHTKNPILEKLLPQISSHQVLKALLEIESTKGLEPQIALHTRELIDNNSPHADDISRALEVLNSYWSQDEIQVTAKAALHNAEYYLGRSAAHAEGKATEDDQTGDVPMESLRDNRQVVKDDIGSGIKQLEAMLDN